jgi:hypothetical protein
VLPGTVVAEQEAPKRRPLNRRSLRSAALRSREGRCFRESGCGTGAGFHRLGRAEGPPKPMKNGEGERMEANISCPTQRIGCPILRVLCEGWDATALNPEALPRKFCLSPPFAKSAKDGPPDPCVGQEIPGVGQDVFRQSAAQSRDLQFLPQVLTQPLHFALRENASQRIVPSCILTCSPRQRGETRRRPFRYGPPSDCFENAKFHGADGQPRCSPKARGPFHSHPWL